MGSIKNPGRFVGLLYLLISIPGFFALTMFPTGIRWRLPVSGGATPR